MLVTGSFQPHRDETLLSIHVLQRHSQNAMSARNCTPIPDALTRATEQHQDRLIAIRDCGIDQLLNRAGFKMLRKRPRNAVTKSVSLSLSWRQVTSDHSMPWRFGEQVAGSWVDATVPGSTTVFRVTANTVLEIGRKDAEAVIDRARLTWLPRPSRADRTLLCTLRELGNVGANHLTCDAVGIVSRDRKSVV